MCSIASAAFVKNFAFTFSAFSRLPVPRTLSYPNSFRSISFLSEIFTRSLRFIALTEGFILLCPRDLNPLFPM